MTKREECDKLTACFILACNSLHAMGARGLGLVTGAREKLEIPHSCLSFSISFAVLLDNEDDGDTDTLPGKLPESLMSTTISMTSATQMHTTDNKRQKWSYVWKFFKSTVDQLGIVCNA